MFAHSLRWISSMALMSGLVGSSALAQEKPKIAGDYVGALGPLHLKLHIAQAADGSLSGTMDSVD